MNIHDQNNRGFLALKLNRAAGTKNETGVSIAKALGIHSTTASKILRGGHASMELYEKVADYLGVSMQEKGILSRLGAQGDDFVGIGAASLLDALGTETKKVKKPCEEIITCIHGSTVAPVNACTICRSKKLTKKDIVEQEMQRIQETRKDIQECQEIADNCQQIIKEIHLPAPIVQNEFTKWQAWVIMALQVVVILFLIFPIR